MKIAPPKPTQKDRSRHPQLSTQNWPKGLSLPIAVIALEPEDFEENSGIHFDDSNDGLDYTKWAILQLPSRAQTALVRHRDCPSPGTEIWIHEETPDRRAALDEMLTYLGLGRDTITWLHPTMSPEQTSL